MSNEAVKVEGQFIAHDFTVADATQISAMTLCYLSGTRTAFATIAGSEVKPFAGIAATEKEANDGSTNLGLFTEGIFVLTAGGTILTGQPVCLSGVNTIRAAAAGDLLTGGVVGKALQDIAIAGTGEVMVGGTQ